MWSCLYRLCITPYRWQWHFENVVTKRRHIVTKFGRAARRNFVEHRFFNICPQIFCAILKVFVQLKYMRPKNSNWRKVSTDEPIWQIGRQSQDASFWSRFLITVPKTFYAILNFSIPCISMGLKTSNWRQTSADKRIKLKFGPHMGGIKPLRLFCEIKIFLTPKKWNCVKIFRIFLENGPRFFRETFRICRGSDCPHGVFSKRQRITLRLLYAIAVPSVVCLSVVCDVGAPYSGGWTFRQFFSPYDSPGTLLFWCQKSLVGTPLSPWNLRSKWPTPFQTAKFRQISAHRA